jgi:hypothetical protein
MPRKKKLKHDDGFEVYLMGGDLNGYCKRCGAFATLQYKGLDPVYPDFHIVCKECGIYQHMKIRMFPEHLTPEPYRGRKLFERWRIKRGWF